MPPSAGHAIPDFHFLESEKPRQQDTSIFLSINQHEISLENRRAAQGPGKASCGFHSFLNQGILGKPLNGQCK